MNAALALHLAPYTAAVQEAQAALDAANRNPNGLTATLGKAGDVIHAQTDLIDAMAALIDPPVVAECGCESDMRTQGRLRTLAEQGAP